MGMNNWLHKKSYIVFFILTIITSVLLGYVSTIEKAIPFETYNGLQSEVVDELNNSKSKSEYRNIIEKNEAISKVKLKNKDKIIQKMTLPTNKTSEMVMDIDVYQNSELKIKVTNEKNIIVYESSMFVTTETKKVSIPLEQLQHDKMDVYEIQIEAASDSQEVCLSIFSWEYSDGTLLVNDKSIKNVLLVKVAGELTIYKEKTVLGVVIITIILMLLTTVCYLKQTEGKYQLQVKINDFLDVKWRMYTLETIGYVILLLVGLRFYTSYTYQANLDLVSMYLFIVLASAWGSFVYFMILKYRYSIHDVFVILAIPLGISFVFLMLPDQVPDEHAHFAKAYLVSTGNLSNSVDVNISTSYGTLALRNYNDILPAIFQFGNYTDTELYSHACPYNFLLYVLPSIGIFVCRVINLSIYFAYYLGRMINLLLFIYVGYRCIKMVPIAKYVFFVYLFNPMVLQQAASFSSDAVVHSLLIFVVAYFLWLYNKDGLLSNRDIISVFGLIFLVVIFKYVYLPVFLMYLLLYKKLLKMNKKQSILFFGASVAILLGYVVMALFTGPLGTMDEMAKYLVDKKVDVTEQIKYIIAHPKGTYYMIKQSLIVHQDFYIQSFVGMFAWLSITLNPAMTSLYLGTMIASPLLVDEKLKFNKAQRAWVGLIGILNMLLVIIAMYITWTTVGHPFAEGVQGRYFIPLVILVLLSYTGSKKILLKNPLKVCALLMLIINTSALFSIIEYFKFLV